DPDGGGFAVEVFFVAQRVERVLQQVHQHVDELVLVGPNGLVLRQVLLDLDLVLPLVAQEAKRGRDNFSNLDLVEVAKVVTSALRFLSNEWKDKVQIKQDLPEHQTIWANKNKLIHVLVNLLQNSLDALGNKKDFNGETPTIWI